ncbi:MAG: membrane protein insertion efficiency factor YidD [Deltaproteobacteria bacterium]|nr:membrane protein insertion efficiency factor YidD [Deltaproteobacteria bacterium]
MSSYFQSLKAIWHNGIRWFSLLLIHFYRVIRPLFFFLLNGRLEGGCCRFYPSCSVYAESLFRDGPLLKAFFLAGRRLLRCHPYADGGIDWPPIHPSETRS